MMKKKVEILTVNYNTPELIKRLIDSRDKFCPGINIMIIDGSEDKTVLQKLLTPFSNYTLDSVGYNIHHGRGLDRGILNSKADYLLLMDSDSYFVAPGSIDYLFEVLGDNYTASPVCYIDKDGYDVRANNIYRYPHPSICLIDKNKYLESPYKFIHHGAPATNIAIGLHLDGLSDCLMEATEISKYILSSGQGTVKKFGYGYTTGGIKNTDNTIFDTKASIILPTMGCSPLVFDMLPKYEASNFIGEIILIDNAPEKNLKERFTQYSKVKYITKGKNIFVNPAWNLGAALAKHEIILANDDILIPDLDKVLHVILLSDFDIIGIDLKETKDEISIDAIEKFPFNSYGCFMRIRNYIYIPDQIKIWQGDRFLFEWNKRKGILRNSGIITPVSVTVKKFYNSICKQDLQLSKSNLSIEDRFNIIIRTSGRPNYFKNCIDSIKKYSPKAKLHITIDNIEDLEYVKKCGMDFNYYVVDKDTIQIMCDKVSIERTQFIYEEYLNVVKPFLKGFTMILDDDDVLVSTPIYGSDINTIHLYKVDIIKKIVPSEENFGIKPVLNDISMIGIVFHSSKMVPFLPQRGGDFDFIDEMCKTNKVVWVDQVLAKTQTGGNFGKRNDIEQPLLDNKKKKIAVVMPVWKRPAVFKLISSYMDLFVSKASDRYDMIVFYVLSSEDEYINTHLAHFNILKHNRKLIYHPNNTGLGSKYNQGINAALKENCDYIMNIDSDDLIHPSILDFYAPYIAYGTDFFGIKNLFFYQLNQKSVLVKNYNGDHLFGAGRMQSKKLILETIKKYGSYYQSELNNGLDGSLSTRVKSLGYIPVKIDSGDLPLLVDIKTDESVNSFEKVVSIIYADKEIINYQNSFIESVFPQLNTFNNKIQEPLKSNNHIELSDSICPKCNNIDITKEFAYRRCSCGHAWMVN